MLSTVVCTLLRDEYISVIERIYLWDPHYLGMSIFWRCSTTDHTSRIEGNVCLKYDTVFSRFLFPFTS